MNFEVEVIEARLRAPFVNARTSVNARRLGLVRLHAAGGTIGHGEAAPLEGYDARFSEIADNQVYIALDHGTSISDVRPKIEAIAKQFPGAKVNDVSGLKAQFEVDPNTPTGGAALTQTKKLKLIRRG